MIVIYNKDCSKCREALDLIEGGNCEFEIRNYLINPLNENELEELVRMIGCTAENLLRKDEPLFKEKFEGKQFSEAEMIKLMAEHPILLQRPIIIDGNKAIIGRPVTLVADLVENRSKTTFP